MTRDELNEKLRTANSDAQLRLLFTKQKANCGTHFTGQRVDTITVNNGFVRYTYVDSNIKGYCKVRNLHHYLTF